jgi:hypothetical protein
MSVLATRTEGSLPRLSQVVARLEQRGWVRRIPDPADGRYTLATLTDQGRAKVAQAAPGHVEEVRCLVFDPLTKAQSRQLREICRRIMRAIDQNDRCPGDQPLPAPPRVRSSGRVVCRRMTQSATRVAVRELLQAAAEPPGVISCRSELPERAQPGPR